MLAAHDRLGMGSTLRAGDGDQRVVVNGLRTGKEGGGNRDRLAADEQGDGGQGVPDGFDEPLSSEPFSFTIDCPSDLDCRDDDTCPPVPARSSAPTSSTRRARRNNRLS